MKILITQPASIQMQKTIKLLKEKLERNPQNTLQNILPNMSQGIDVEIWDSAKSLVTCADIKKSEADIFVNFNLAGFEQSTLTDGIAYNLLNCKQIHILLKDELPEEKYLARQLSISMFFYCTDAEYCKYLQDKYPDIPYLRTIEEWEKDREENSVEDHAEALERIVREVIRFCRMLPQ